MRGEFVKCGQGCSSDADVCTFWCKKIQIFQNLWCVSHGREAVGLVSANILQTRRSIFCNFVQMSLWMTPNN